MYTMVKTVAISMDGLNLSSLLSKEFVDKIKEKEPNLTPIALIMVNSINEKGINALTTISLNHTNNEDVQKKRINVNSLDEKLLENMQEILKKLGAK